MRSSSAFAIAVLALESTSVSARSTRNAAGDARYTVVQARDAEAAPAKTSAKRPAARPAHHKGKSHKPPPHKAAQHKPAVGKPKVSVAKKAKSHRPSTTGKDHSAATSKSNSKPAGHKAPKKKPAKAAPGKVTSAPSTRPHSAKGPPAGNSGHPPAQKAVVKTTHGKVPPKKSASSASERKTSSTRPHAGLPGKINPVQVKTPKAIPRGGKSVKSATKGIANMKGAKYTSPSAKQAANKPQLSLGKTKFEKSKAMERSKSPPKGPPVKSGKLGGPTVGWVGRVDHVDKGNGAISTGDGLAIAGIAVGVVSPIVGYHYAEYMNDRKKRKEAAKADIENQMPLVPMPAPPVAPEPAPAPVPAPPPGAASASGSQHHPPQPALRKRRAASSRRMRSKR